MNDRMRVITAVAEVGPATVRLNWSDGTIVDLDLGAALADPAFAALRDSGEFAQVAVGDWGHSLVWPGKPDIELGADRLWRETLSATGHDDARAFLEWRLRHSLSLAKAAEALGISRRMVAYYSNGDKKLPKPILLACRGWEVGERLENAA